MAARVGDGAVSPAKLAKVEQGTAAATAAPLGVAAASASSLQPAAAASAKVAGQIFPIWKDKFPITKNQIDTAREIVEILATSTFAGLTAQKANLNERGNSLDKVHPLCLLWALFADEKTKKSLGTLKEIMIPFSALLTQEGTSVWDTFLGYSKLADKGYGKSLEQWYKGKTFDEVKSDFDAFYKALKLEPEVMNELLKQALLKQPKEEPEEAPSSGWFGSLVAGAVSVAASVAQTFEPASEGAWDPFLSALLDPSSYIKKD